jgi:hypothetical protein
MRDRISDAFYAVAYAFDWVLVRAKVIVKAAPTVLAAVALLAPLVASDIAEALPAPWSERVTSVGLTVAAVATALVSVIRRLTPVPPSERGLL